uniref:Uncharacterized protein n=1 Tax=Physcomitrium patens TaxID=3218 RepID=A0A2K1JRD9_PHYPA|nr:hypothetical protein PHYPA_016482 [Physcomitrium patens]
MDFVPSQCIHGFFAVVIMVRSTQMVLGPHPSGLVFSPEHKSNAYDKAENG